LPEVSETFEANVGPWVAGLEAMIRAAERARDMNYELIASMEMIAEAGGSAARAAAEDAAANMAAAGAAGDAARAETELAAADTAAAAAAADAAKTEYLLAMAQRLRAKSTDEATAATAASTVAFGRWGLTWNALHWIIAGGAELLAVTLPAAVAAGAAAFVLYQGVVEQVGTRLQSLYTTTEATGAMMHQTTGDVLGLGHAFQTAQNAANPIAYQLLGEYVMAARSHMVDLAGAGLKVDQALGALGAKINVDLIQQGPALSGLLSNMVQDLIEIGQVFGNVGHAVLNFASDMPGLAEVLLRVADAISRVILWISELPRWLITTFMVFEELSRWGGLVVTVFGRLGLATSALGGSFFSLERYGGILSNLFKAIPMLAANAVTGLGSLMQAVASDEYAFGRAGTAVKAFGEDTSAAIAGLGTAATLGIGAAVLVIGGLVYEMFAAKGAAAELGDSLQQAVEKAKNVQAFSVIADNLLTLTQAQNQAAASAKGLSKEMQGTGVEGSYRGLSVALGQARQNFQGLSQAMQQQFKDLNNLATGGGKVSKEFGLSMAQALGLADIAGVNLSTTTVRFGKDANQAGIQIEALVQGYQRMDQVGGILGNDMNAVAAAAGLQNTKVSSLNQAWDQFLSNATGLTSGIAGLNTDIGQINNAITTAGTRFTVFGGKVVSSTDAAAHALTSFSGTGAQVWQNYNAALQQAQQYTDSLRIAAASGAVGQRAFTQQIAYTVGELLPYAKYSSAAAAELSILAQEAGGPATSSYKALKEWVDKNTESTKQFNKQTALETGTMSDATKVAESFASTLNSAVAAALQAGTLASANLTGQTQKLDSAWTQAGNHVAGPVVGAFRGLVTSLTQVYGNTKTAIGVADAYMRQQGATAAQVARLNQQIAGTVAWLSRIHSPPPVTITVNGDITGSGAAAIAALGGYGGGGEGGAGHRVLPGGQTGAQYAAAGLTLVGEQGPELVRFGGGESILPSWQTAAALHGGGGGEGTVHLATQNVVNVGGQRMQSQIVTQSLVYSRRNPSNNLALRTR
jgi:hypothetical protein